MHVSTRSYLSAGVAVLGAGAIALSPVQPLGAAPAPLPQKAIGELAVSLAAAVTPVDPIQNIIDVITATGNNLEVLLNDWSSGLYVDGTLPFPPNTGICLIGCNGNLGWRTGGYSGGVGLPILAQMLSNLQVYLSELPDIGTIAGQIFGNIGNALRAPFEPGVNQQGRVQNIPGFTSDYYNQNVNGIQYFNAPVFGTLSQRDVAALLPTLAGDSYASLEPIVNFATTPISGVIVGAIGPIVAPVLAVVDGISNAIALLQESNFQDALIELINIPANTIGAVLNGGQTLDLTPVLGLLGVTLPDTITSIGLKMGGLLSPGGVAFDSLAAVASVPNVLDVTVPGLPVGPIGALASLTNYVAKSIAVAPPAQTAAAVAAASSVAAPEAAAPESIADAMDSDAAAETAAASAPVEAAAEPDDAAKAAPRVGRSGRSASASDDSGASASTPKRAGRSAASRAG
ncbi:hypothetical protein [Mycolicibacterium sp.]|uniref:hypothetical protein n=1 Tax=Mycolicibacterium sp. TaxID=2320850 RepID=UPI001D9EC5FD|nr:hypothetical protein [Mycolicibacterium sp.]MCB1289964.1 hypothetical protein [Mycobacterium sp.]MCB9408543.1 hypothetical protein [Mycolicibacterium sp.]